MIPVVGSYMSYWNSNTYLTYYDCWFRYFGYSISLFVSILHTFVICIEHVLVLYGKISRAKTYRRNIKTILSIWSLGTIITVFGLIVLSSYCRYCSRFGLTSYNSTHLWRFGFLCEIYKKYSHYLNVVIRIKFDY